MVKNDKFPIMYHDLTGENGYSILGYFDFDMDGDIEFSPLMNGQYKSAIKFRLSDNSFKCLSRNEFALNILYEDFNYTTEFDSLADIRYKLFGLQEKVECKENSSLKILFKLRLVSTGLFKTDYYKHLHMMKQSAISDFIPHKKLESALEHMDYYMLKSIRELEYAPNIVDELGERGELRYYDGGRKKS